MQSLKQLIYKNFNYTIIKSDKKQNLSQNKTAKAVQFLKKFKIQSQKPKKMNKIKDSSCKSYYKDKCKIG